MSAVVLTAGMVTHAVDGRLVAGAAEVSFTGVSTDSRTLPEGALFVALQGDRFDGHAFVDEAIRRGAAGLLVNEPPAIAGDATVIVVRDTLAGLQALGRTVRRASGATVIAITGSAGKTTTKEITAELLATRFRVFRTRGNLNNHIGLPLSLIELRHDPEMAVLELGMNHAGEIRLLVDLAQPDVRVLTNIGDAHIGHFGSREALGRAKAEILEGARADTLAVLNADAPLVMAHARGFAGRVRTFGEAPGADVRATDVVDRGFDGTSAAVATPAGTVRLHVPLAGRAQLSNVLAGVAVAIEFGVPLDVIAARVSALQPVSRRGAVTTLASGVRLIDDSYNASPAAVDAMLASLAATPVSGRRVAVIGEMLELGDRTLELHEATGRAAAAARIDVLVAIGGAAAKALSAGALAAGLAASRVHHFTTSAAASVAMSSIVQPGDVVLVKGSRGTRTDVVVDRLAEGA